MISDIDLYIHQFNDRINTLRANYKTSLYDFDVEFSSQEKRSEAKNRIEEYFRKFGYGVDIRMCSQCGGRKCDIIITWGL